MKNKAISVARVSDIDQADNTSIGAQHDVNRMVMEGKGYEVIREFSEVVRGGDDRASVKEALEFCKRHNSRRRPKSDWVTILVVHSLSRWFRDTELSGYYRYLFRQVGVDVQAATEWTDKEKSGQVVLRSLREAMAEEESTEGRRRSLKGVYYTWKAGWYQGQAPRGYVFLKELDSRGKRIFTQDPDLAPYYREAYTMIAAGLEPTSVYNQLGGRPIFGGLSTYYKAIKSEIYAGMKFYTSKIPGLPDLRVKLNVEAIVDLHTWQQAQAQQLNGKKGTVNASGDSAYFASKSFRCACGSATTHETSKGRNDVYHYYRCSKNQKHGRNRVGRVHGFIATIFSSLEMSTAAKEYLQAQAAEKVGQLVKDVSGRIGQLKTSLDGLEQRRMKALKLFADEKITAEDYEVFREESEKVRATIARQQFLRDNQYQLIPKVLNLFLSLGTLYDQLDGNQRRALLTMLFPAGFYVTTEKPNDEILACRTTRINSIFSLTDSGIMQYVQIEKGPTPLGISPLQNAGGLGQQNVPEAPEAPLLPYQGQNSVVYPQPDYNRTAEDFAAFNRVYQTIQHLLPAA